MGSQHIMKKTKGSMYCRSHVLLSSLAPIMPTHLVTQGFGGCASSGLWRRHVVRLMAYGILLFVLPYMHGLTELELMARQTLF